MEKLLIYVTVGTCHFKFNRMLKQVKSCLETIPDEFEVVLQHGSSDLILLPNCIKAVDFLSRDESEQMYKNADLVFSHTGIGSIFNSLKYNRPTVLCTRLEKYQEFSDNHQLQIAKEIQSNDLIYYLNNQKEDLEAFSSFYKSKRTTIKSEVDLTNYKLANFIKERLYK